MQQQPRVSVRKIVYVRTLQEEIDIFCLDISEIIRALYLSTKFFSAIQSY